jgi:hypothetical protein
MSKIWMSKLILMVSAEMRKYTAITYTSAKVRAATLSGSRPSQRLVVKLPKFAKYAEILKNSCYQRDSNRATIPNERPGCGRGGGGLGR